MSRFYGVIRGAARTPATRRGHRFLIVQAASWDGAIEVELTVVDGRNHFTVRRIPWHGAGRAETIAAGFFDG